MLKKTFFIFLALNYLIISGCMNVPKNQGDACSIIKQKKSWRSALKKTERKWGVSPGMQLAFIKTESNFRPTARTERKYFLGVIPSGRISSAYGYSQALDGTWKEYKKSTGHKYHRRSNFAHSTNFIGWYINKTNKILKISKKDAYRQYLAYYKGWGDYKNYSKDKKAIIYAKSVKDMALKYRKQLTICKKNLDKNKYIIF
jgi:hypothetical protein